MLGTKFRIVREDHGNASCPVQMCRADTPRYRLILIRWLLACLAALLFFSPARAAVDDCVKKGGRAICTAPTVTEWKHSLCDDAGPYASRYAAWCTVMGGTWKGLYEGCIGADAQIEEPEIYPYSEAFERIIHNVRNCSMTGDDKGWLSPGESISSWNCWSGQPQYQNGIEVSNLRQMLFSGQSYDIYTQSCRGGWQERVMARRDRSIECPVGYTKRYRNGVHECFKPVDACPTAGNPIKIASGAKILQQTDYPAAGGSSL